MNENDMPQMIPYVVHEHEASTEREREAIRRAIEQL